MLLWVVKWCWEETAKDSKAQGCPCKVCKPDNAERVREVMLKSSHRSAWRQTLMLCLEDGNVFGILHKDLHYYPYQTSADQDRTR